jgi:hypothetical protein
MAKAPIPSGENEVALRLAKPTGFAEDSRQVIERTVYYKHCENLATVIAAASVADRQAAINAYLTASNADTIEAP